MVTALQYIAAVLVVAFGLWVFGTSSSFRTCKTEQTASNAEQRKENPPPFALAAIDSAAICARCAGHVIYEYRDAATAFATVLIALFTFTLKRSTDKLWLAGERQLAHAQSESEAAEFQRKVQFDQMSEQIGALQQSAAAAEDSARETRSLVWNAEATAERQLRAYIQIKEVVMSLLNSEYDPNSQIIIKNFGQTPARQITNTHEVKAAYRPRDTDFNLNTASKGEVSDLAPSQHVFSQFTIPINQWNDLKPALISKKQAFYVFGRIDYIDAFNKARWTEYRFKLLVDATGIHDDDMFLIMEGHAGNRAN